jgi:diaminohydroxyphosphoribosylaminopyrimidine deaminase/5-amino-6-(5-phosphoribosylamino)uracil reductase
MGLRAVPGSARIHEGPGTALVLPTRDPHVALISMWERGIRDVWLEGGPTLAAAFVAAGLVDEVYAYIAPALLGSGRAAVGELGIGTIGDMARLALEEVTAIGGDVRIHALAPHAVPGRTHTPLPHHLDLQP